MDKKNLLRKREIFDENLVDFASNDYLNIGENKNILNRAFENIKDIKNHSPKASYIVNGYSKIHQNFQNNLKSIHKFEDSICVGSGFLANIALLEALPRKGDTLFIDEEFHASGILASKLTKANVVLFSHNDYKSLECLIKKCQSNRIIIAIEGIYSMSGDICDYNFFKIAKKYNCLIIVDEAHSSGVIGNNCLGVMDFYNIPYEKNIIKMGTLGKAYGSYGAYILASKQIIAFLQSRAKSIIYSTAISLFDISLANESFLYIQDNINEIYNKIQSFKNEINKELNINKEALIFPFSIGDNKKVIHMQNQIKQKNILVGAVRTPTVKCPILRITGNIDKKQYIKIMSDTINKALNNV